jgi:MoxR-like ATPase
MRKRKLKVSTREKCFLEAPKDPTVGANLPAETIWLMMNAALYLRRPLLVTGRPGVGKSSLAYSVAEELKLGAVL